MTYYNSGNKNFDASTLNAHWLESLKLAQESDQAITESAVNEPSLNPTIFERRRHLKAIYQSRTDNEHNWATFIEPAHKAVSFAAGFRALSIFSKIRKMLQFTDFCLPRSLRVLELKTNLKA